MKREPPKRDEATWALTVHLTRFVNAAFSRRLGPSRALYDAVKSAAESGYSADEMRLAFWVARCIAGEHWLKAALRMDYERGPISPDLVLRHKGGTNPQTGQPAKRWLDEMVSRAMETSPALVDTVLRGLPAEMRNDERALLERMNVPIGEDNG